MGLVRVQLDALDELFLRLRRERRAVTVRAASVSVEAPRPSATLSHFRQIATFGTPGVKGCEEGGLG